MAIARGLTAIALTDHDTLGGVAKAQQAAYGTGLEVIAGVEINADGGQRDLHILGYYVDPENGPLQERLQAMREARIGRARRMIERLRELGMVLEMEEVQTLASGDSIGRPHVARALLNRGYVETLQEAFDRLLGRDGLAYVPRLRLTPPEAIQAILEAGGIPVLAHPAHSGSSAVERIPELANCGLRGLEVYYPHHSSVEVELLLELCQECELFATGGTDFHSPDSEEGAPMGSVYVPLACAVRLREAAGR